MTQRFVVVALACVLALTGCGGDDKKTAKPKPTRSASPSPSPSGTPTPNKPEVTPPVEPAYAKGKEGKEAFAEYVVQAWAYSLATNDSSLLDKASVAGKPCEGCQAQSETLAKRKSEGWSVYPFEVTIDKIRLIESALGTTAQVRFDIPETKSFFDDGKFRNTSPAHPESTFTISMRKAKKGYKLVGFTIS